MNQKQDSEILRNMFLFQLGISSDFKMFEPPKGLNLYPALLAPYLDLEKLRYNYPLCLLKKGTVRIAVPLMEIIDQFCSSLDEEKDEEKRKEVFLLKMENALKILVKDEEEKSLEKLWIKALEITFSSLDMKKEKNQKLKKEIKAFQENLPKDALLIGCHSNTPVEIIQLVQQCNIHNTKQLFDNALGSFLMKLEDILATDKAKAKDFYNANRLKESLGETQDVNFSKLAEILPQTEQDRLAPERIKRIEATIETLKTLKSLYHKAKTENVYFPKKGLEEILDELQKKKELGLEIAKGLQIAQLEATDKYRDERHDAFFGNFDWDNVPRDEIAWLPPVTVVLKTSELREGDRSLLFDILTWRFPIKLVLLVEDLENYPSDWMRDIAQMVISMQRTFVYQGTYCKVADFITEVRKGIEYTGPSFFHIYVGDGKTHMNNYLETAIALESRAFPSFTYNPSQGQTWQESFSIRSTPQHEKDWTVSDVECLDENKKRVTLTLPFTYGDFLGTHEKYKKSFMWVPPEHWISEMKAFYECLDTEKSMKNVPYIVMVDDTGKSHRLVVNQNIIHLCQEYLFRWKRLQELGGINNSHALKQIAEEREILEKQKQSEMKNLEQKYQKKMEENLGKVAESIVDKIASGLLGLGQSNFVSSPVPVPQKSTQEAPKKVKEESSAPQAPEPVVDEDICEEAFIESARCISCNECISINKRLFAYDGNKQAFIKDLSTGTYRQLVEAAEKCPARIIHPGKPLNPDEEGLEDLSKRAEPFNKL